MPSIGRIDLTAMRVPLARRAAEVATAILGSPNLVLSSARELRFGKRGSISVVIVGRKAGCWFDHENGVGLLDLIEGVSGDFHQAITFAEEIIGPAPRQFVLTSHPISHAASRDKDNDNNRRSDRALVLWNEAVPIGGTIAEIYLINRGIRKLPEGVDNSVLRFHPQCPFGEKTHYPCLIALMREIHSNEPRAIQRTALTAVGKKIGRLTLGPKVRTASSSPPTKSLPKDLRSARDSKPCSVRCNWVSVPHGHLAMPTMFDDSLPFQASSASPSSSTMMKAAPVNELHLNAHAVGLMPVGKYFALFLTDAAMT
jgi:hypothetical protein